VARQANDTLRQVLAAKHLATDATKLANFDKSIASWAELDDANQYVIAYYLNDGTNELNPPLFIDRYDRKRAEWKSASFPDAHTNSAQPDDNCYGSILRVAALGSRFFLDTHINPSAGCLLILSENMKLQASLYGWMLGHVGEDAVIYHKSEIHFAPVHPAESYAGLGSQLPPLGHVGQVSDIVDGILFLESAPFVTGEILHIDGGEIAGH